jgi:hypothetical protein
MNKDAKIYIALTVWWVSASPEERHCQRHTNPTGFKIIGPADDAAARRTLQ